MSDNDEVFGQVLEGLPEDEQIEKKPTAKKPRKASAKKPAPKVEEPEVVIHQDSGLPDQGPKSEWPVIVVDEQEGQPNFQFVQVNGVPFQIQRGVETPVPPAVLSVLNNAVATRISNVRDPGTGQVKTMRQNYSAVPFRVLRWGSKK